jgi:hypothetical protein
MNRGVKVLYILLFAGAISLGSYLYLSLKPAGVKAVESQIGPLLFKGSPGESVFTDQYIQIQWYADFKFLGEPQVHLKFYASREQSEAVVDSQAIRIQGEYEEFLISKDFMGYNLVPVRAPFISIYFSSRGKPSEDEIKETLLKNIKVKPATAEAFFNSPEIQAVLAESRSEKEKFLKIMKNRFGFENPKAGTSVSKSIDKWAVVELKNHDDYSYYLTYYIALEDSSKVMTIVDNLLDSGLVTGAGVGSSEQFKEKYPLHAGESFAFRGSPANLSKRKMLYPSQFKFQLGPSRPV